MSTLHNRRRGAKANKPRKPRTCAFPLGCPRLAPRNRYCDDHQRNIYAAGNS